MAAITTKTVGKPAEKPKAKVAVTDIPAAKNKLFQLGNMLGPKSEAKRLLNEAMGLLQ